MRGSEPHLSERGDGLRSTGSDGDAAESFDEGIAEDPVQLTRADARQEHHHFELTRAEAAGEVEDGIVRGDGRFPHRRGDEWVTALFADQLGDFVGSAALEREHATALQRHTGIIPADTIRTGVALP